MKLGRAPLITCVLVCGSTFAVFAACGRPELPITVQKSRAGLHSDIQPGERLPIKRVASREFAGAKPGFYALRSKYEFEVFRADLPKSRALPPKDVTWGDEMLIAGYSPDANMDKLGIDAVVDTGPGGLHVYATQYTSGEGCPQPQANAAFDMVAVPNADRPITVHLDTDRGPPCHASPLQARVVCHIANTPTWQAQLSAPWQSTIECEIQTEPAARPIIDRNWVIAEAAKGSTTRLTMSRGNSRVSFPIDALGRYVIRLEAFDDQGKRGDTVATIDSAPPNDDTYVQFGWSKFTSTDELETFPRLDYRVADVGPKGHAVRNVCSPQGQRPTWCEVTTSPTVTVMRLAENPGRYGVAVRYLDDRYQGMPVACVRVFKKRALVTEVCDDTPRKSGTTWESGVLLATIGYFEGMMQADAGAEGGTLEGGAPTDASADGGARASDASTDGVTTAAAKQPVAKPAAPKPAAAPKK